MGRTKTEPEKMRAGERRKLEREERRKVRRAARAARPRIIRDEMTEPRPPMPSQLKRAEPREHGKTPRDYAVDRLAREHAERKAKREAREAGPLAAHS